MNPEEVTHTVHQENRESELLKRAYYTAKTLLLLMTKKTDYACDVKFREELKRYVESIQVKLYAMGERELSL